MRLIDADALIVELNKRQIPYNVRINKAIMDAPTIEICFCRECKLEWTQKCPPHRMGLIHDENDYCSYGIRKGADDE